jgi:hypothetical protein
MIPSVYGSSAANPYYVPSQEEQNFLAIRDIVAPLEYFENAERSYSMNNDPLSIEMMSNAIQAYVKQLPEAVDEALSLVDRMPPECLQRNDVFIAILDACSHFEKKIEILDRISHFQHYALAVKDLFTNQSLSQQIEIVYEKFPECRNRPQDLEVIVAILANSE